MREKKTKAWNKGFSFQLVITMTEVVLIDEESLINAIIIKPELWNIKLSVYKNRRKKEQAWGILAVTFNCDAEDVKKAWKALRDKYVREKKMIAKTKRSGSGSSSKPQWEHFESLSFLDDMIQHRSTSTNLDKEQIDPIIEGDILATSILESIGEVVNIDDITATSTQTFPTVTQTESQFNSAVSPILSPSQQISSALPTTTHNPSQVEKPVARKRKRIDTTDKELLEIMKTNQDIINKNMSNEKPTIDANELFLMSLKPRLDALSEIQNSTFKIEIMSALHKLQFHNNDNSN